VGAAAADSARATGSAGPADRNRQGVPPGFFLPLPIGPPFGSYLRIAECELEAGGPDWPTRLRSWSLPIQTHAPTPAPSITNVTLLEPMRFPTASRSSVASV